MARRALVTSGSPLADNGLAERREKNFRAGSAPFCCLHTARGSFITQRTVCAEWRRSSVEAELTGSGRPLEATPF